MTTLQIIITLLVVSVSLNAVAVWYVRGVLTRLLFVSNNLGEVNDVLVEFTEHVDKIHSMETFYGDQTLQSLLGHSRLVTEMLGEFDDIYKIAEGFKNLGEEIEEVENEEGEVAHGETS